MSKVRPTHRYKITNWKDYNKSLVLRGSLTIWIEEGITDRWHAPKEAKRNGHPLVYSDEVILMALTIRYVYNLPLRALEGFLCSILAIMGVLLNVPSYTQICRRAKTMGKHLERVTKRRPTDIVFDSTGLKVYGEGEWKVRTHGVSKLRTWRKLHLAIDPASGEIVVAKLTDNSAGDAPSAVDMLDSVHGNVQRVYGDGAYDSMNFRKKVWSKGAISKVPPPRNAVMSKSTKGAHLQRNNAIATINGLGGGDTARSLWKKLEGYHTRSLVETTMFRYKTIFGPTLRSRSWDNQQTEGILKCLTLNKMTRMGMPRGVWTDT
jgi:hypothetical protein